MGTNYYARYSPCPTCGRCSVEKHIGKASCGWKFLLQSHPDISSWEDWKKELSDSKVQIFDEYNEKISTEKLFELVDSKQNDDSHESDHCWKDTDGYDLTWKEFS